MQKLLQHHSCWGELAASLQPRTDVSSVPLLCRLGSAGFGLWAPDCWYPSVRAPGVCSWPSAPARWSTSGRWCPSLPDTQHIIPNINPAFNMAQVQSTPPRGHPTLSSFLGDLINEQFITELQFWETLLIARTHYHRVGVLPDPWAWQMLGWLLGSTDSGTIFWGRGARSLFIYIFFVAPCLVAVSH